MVLDFSPVVISRGRVTDDVVPLTVILMTIGASPDFVNLVPLKKNKMLKVFLFIACLFYATKVRILPEKRTIQMRA